MVLGMGGHKSALALAADQQVLGRQFVYGFSDRALADLVTRRQLKLPDTAKGVVIASLNPSSDAAANALQRGDLIVQINQRPVNTPAEAAAAVEDARKAGRDTVLLLVQRGPNPARYIGVKLMTPKTGAK